MKKVIDDIKVKLVKLIEKHNQFKIDISNLQQDNDLLNAKINNKEKEIIALKDKIKLINISKSVDTNKEDIKATRMKINEYVREIDKCIALLNK